MTEHPAADDPPAEPQPSGRVTRPLAVALAAAFVVLVLDQITKQWAVTALEPGPCGDGSGCIDVVWTLRFHLVRNPGAAFSSLTSAGELIAVIALAMTGYLLYRARRTTDRLLAVIYGVVAGGAVGNVFDRVFRAEDGFLSGEVIDFIDFQWWPIFNVADMAVIGGVIALGARIAWLERANRPYDVGEVDRPSADVEVG